MVLPFRKLTDGTNACRPSMLLENAALIWSSRKTETATGTSFKLSTRFCEVTVIFSSPLGSAGSASCALAAKPMVIQVPMANARVILECSVLGLSNMVFSTNSFLWV